MTMTAAEMSQLMSNFDGGSPDRFSHDWQPRFVFTEGVMAVVQQGRASWFLDLLAFEFAPVIKRSFLKDGTTMVQVKLSVAADQRSARVSILVAGTNQVLRTDTIGSTTFPQGDWYFYIYPCQEGSIFYCEMILLDEY